MRKANAKGPHATRVRQCWSPVATREPSYHGKSDSIPAKLQAIRLPASSTAPHAQVSEALETADLPAWLIDRSRDDNEQVAKLHRREEDDSTHATWGPMPNSGSDGGKYGEITPCVLEQLFLAFSRRGGTYSVVKAAALPTSVVAPSLSVECREDDLRTSLEGLCKALRGTLTRSMCPIYMTLHASYPCSCSGKQKN